MENLLGNEAYATQAARKKQSAKTFNFPKVKRKARRICLP
jgi:hypothetical protein